MKNSTPTPEKKEKKIDIRDFERTPLGYLSYKLNDIEITIEPCLNGADVAVCKNMELLEPKRCTNIKGFTTAEDYLGFSKTVMGWANEYAVTNLEQAMMWLNKHRAMIGELEKKSDTHVE